MKKKLEADLISIAHRILQLKNKSDVNQLYLETQKLYEKLAVLRFVEDYFEDPKPTIGQAEVLEKIDSFYENNAIPELQEPVTTIEPIAEQITSSVEIIEEEAIEEAAIETTQEEIIAEAEEIIDVTEEVIETESEPIPTMEEPEVIVAEIIETTAPIEEPIVSEKLAFTPIVEAIETAIPEPPKKKEAVQISFDDFLGGKYTDPQFVKVDSLQKKKESETVKSAPSFDFQKETSTAAFAKEESKSITLNDKLAKEISIGLNDRIAFVKHLFGGSNEDYNRVVNQLITFDSFLETKSFIEEMVKPDYNDWEGKEDYEHRFMEIIEKKFLSF